MRVVNNNKFILICLPFAGGSSTFYNKWKQYLPPNIELCVYELAGRGIRASDPIYYTCIEDIALDLVSKMDADNIFNKPYFLFGHSLGALITVKLCDLIRERKKNLPAHIFLSGEGAPSFTREQKMIHLLDDSDFVSELRKLGGMTDDFFIYPDLQEYYLPILRSDLKIAETAVFENIAPFNFNMSVFVGREDNWTSDQIYKWNSYTTDICSFHFFNGGHFYLTDYGKEIIHIIKCCI